jgi:hypothetical protein
VPNKSPAATIRGGAFGILRCHKEEMKIPKLPGWTWLLAALFCSAPLQAQVLSAADAALLERARTAILQGQLRDGAIPVVAYKSAGQPAYVNPYFANLACLGLLSAHDYKANAATLPYVEKWLNKFADLQEANGTIADYNGRRGANGELSLDAGQNPKLAPDSNDSYAATHLTVAAEYRAAGGAPSEKIKASCRKSFSVLQRCRDDNGFFWTFAADSASAGRLRVQYLLDNIEVHRGLVAAQALFVATGDADKANQAHLWAQILAEKLSLFWLPTQRYFVVLFADKAANISWGGQPLKAEGLATVSALAFFENLSKETRSDLWAKLFATHGAALEAGFRSADFASEDPAIERVYLAAFKAAPAAEKDALLMRLRLRATQLLNRNDLLTDSNHQGDEFPYVHRFGLLIQALLAQRGALPGELPSVSVQP